MKRYAAARIILIMAVVLAAFAAIEGLGSYLVQQLSQFDETTPIIEAPAEQKVIKRQTLRLDTVQFYMLQVGSFSDAALGQNVINQLADCGYRVYTKEGPPYKLWIGCFSEKEGLAEIPEPIKQYGQDIFVVSGILNEVALTFGEDQTFIKDNLVPLIGESDVMLKHSLKMFQRANYDQYADEIWQQMIEKINGEIDEILQKKEDILLEDDYQLLAKALVDFGDSLTDYQQSLLMITEKKNDQMVLLTQSYLQQAIAGYHNLILAANQSGEENEL